MFRTKFTLSLFALGIIVTLGSNPAHAALVYGTPADLTGDRSVGNGLVGTGVYSGSAFSIEWEITNNGNGTYTYSYVFSGFEGVQGGGISHFTLDLSDNYDANTVTDAELDGNPIGAGDIELFPGTKDGVTGGIKFDLGGDFDDLTYSFVSNRVPVWHNLFVKAGLGSAQNTGLGNEGVSMDELDFIAAPNSQIVPPAIPEPSTVILFGLGLIGLIGFGQKRLRKRQS